VTPRVKPWKIVSYFPGRAQVIDRDSGQSIGRIENVNGWRCWVEHELIRLDIRTRTEAAALVYQAHIERSKT
jgi:hypothetical protein